MSYDEHDLRTALAVLERLAPAGDPGAAVVSVEQPRAGAARRNRLVAVAGAVAAVLAVAVGLVYLARAGSGRNGTAAPIGPASTAANETHGITTTLVVATDRLAAGTPLAAHLVVDNATGHAVRYRGNCNVVAPRIVLANRTHPASFPLVPCPSAEPVRTLPPGRTTIALTVRTWAGSCGGTGSVCGPDGEGRALPPGTYRTVVSWAAAAAVGVPAPAPVTVTLTAR